MSNVKVNGTTYSNVGSVKIPLAVGEGFATYAEANFQEKTVTENGVVTPDSGYSGLSKVTVNVPTSAETLAAASGTITLEADQVYIKVTGLSFTPKAFKLKWVGTAEQNSTAGGFYVRGFSGIYRTASNSSAISGSMSNVMNDADFTVEDDSFSPGYGGACYVLQHGFAVSGYNATFPFRSGQELAWYAIGEVTT